MFRINCINITEQTGNIVKEHKWCRARIMFQDSLGTTNTSKYGEAERLLGRIPNVHAICIADHLVSAKKGIPYAMVPVAW
jgi:hypothetical protein